MPRAEITINEENIKPKFIMYLTPDDMIVLVKDKFINWKELVYIPYIVLILLLIDNRYVLKEVLIPSLFSS